MKITVKIPSRGRPKQLLETLRGFAYNCSVPSQVEYIVSLDEDDQTMKDAGVLSDLSKIPNCHIFFSQPAGKIDACNRDMHHAAGDIYMLIADDLVCIQQAWDAVIVTKMIASFPHLNGCLHFPDGIQNENLCTHPVIGKHYFQKFGYFWNPSYKAFFCDNEFTDIAKSTGKMRYVPIDIFRHDHPLRGQRKSDALNARDSEFSRADQRTFHKRLETGYDGVLPIHPKSSLPQVLIIIPSNGAWRAKMAGNLSGLLLHHAYNHRQHLAIRGVIDEQCSNTGFGRNHAVEKAMTMREVTHVLFIDTDAVFPVDILYRLLKEDRDVIGVQALRRQPPYTPTGEKRQDGKWTLGCHVMLIKKTMFDQIAFPWFNGHYLPNGEWRGEDQDFCDKVNEISQVYCAEDISMKVGHLGEMGFFLEMLGNIDSINK